MTKIVLTMAEDRSSVTLALEDDAGSTSTTLRKEGVRALLLHLTEFEQALAGGPVGVEEMEYSVRLDADAKER